MSRVADALKRANAAQPAPVRTEHWSGQVFLNPEGTRASPPRLASETVTRFADLKARANRLGRAIFASAAEKLSAPRDWKDHPLLRRRWVRRLFRLAGLRAALRVPTCGGVTRLGQPCRGLAMANGLCRRHGGSRSGILAERTRNLLERISPAG